MWNLSALLQLGNTAEVHNYISLLSGILNRLSLDARCNTGVLRHMRKTLISTMCGVENREQVHKAKQTGKDVQLDFSCILITCHQIPGGSGRQHSNSHTACKCFKPGRCNDSIHSLSLMKRCKYVFPSLGFSLKVTLASARKVTLHVRSMSEKFWKPGAAPWSSLDEKTLNTLVDLLSHSLKATVASDNFTEDSAPSGGSPTSIGRRPAVQRLAMQLVIDTLETASDLILVGGNNHELWKYLSLN